jgi:hypothetical protein
LKLRAARWPNQNSWIRCKSMRYSGEFDVATANIAYTQICPKRPESTSSEYFSDLSETLSHKKYQETCSTETSEIWFANLKGIAPVIRLTHELVSQEWTLGDPSFEWNKRWMFKLPPQPAEIIFCSFWGRDRRVYSGFVCFVQFRRCAHMFSARVLPADVESLVTTLIHTAVLSDDPIYSLARASFTRPETDRIENSLSGRSAPLSHKMRYWLKDLILWAEPGR